MCLQAFECGAEFFWFLVCVGFCCAGLLCWGELYGLWLHHSGRFLDAQYGAVFGVVHGVLPSADSIGGASYRNRPQDAKRG